MTIQTVNLGALPNGVGGDTPRSANTKINANFTDSTNAASRLIGTGEISKLTLNQDLLVGAYAPITMLGSEATPSDINLLTTGRGVVFKGSSTNFVPSEWTSNYTVVEARRLSNGTYQIGYATEKSEIFYRASLDGVTWSPWARIYNTANTTKEAVTGYLKAASPILHLYDDSIEKEHEATEQNIIIEKLGVGDYLIKGSTGMRAEGWNLSPPKDIHGNVLCFVEATEADGNINIKTFKRKFDFDIVAIVADHDQPFDIPQGRSVDIRLNDLPQVLEPTEE